MGFQSKANELNIITRREVEALLVKEIFRGLEKKYNKKEACSLLSDVIRKMAIESGVMLAKKVGGNSTKHFDKGLEQWKANNALKIDVLTLNDYRYDFNVTDCCYVEMYKKLGLLELGTILSCQRDFALLEGFNPHMTLTRTQTIMEGAKFCDFRIQLQK